MRAIHEWSNEGWIGISLGIKRDEIDALVAKLLALKDDADQHFHLSSNYEGDGGVGDIEIYVQQAEASNMMGSSFAMAPGSQIQ